MLSFLATTENTNKKNQNDRIYNSGKVLKKTAGNCYSLFPLQNKTRVEPSNPEIGGEIITREEYNYSN